MASRLDLRSPTTRLLAVLGTAAIAVLGYFVWLEVVEIRSERRVAQLQAAIDQVQRERAQLQHEMSRVRQEAERTADEAEALIRRQLGELHAAVLAAQRQLEALEQARKDAAWRSFFRPIKGCEAWRNDEHMVECQNYVIRAKREFEQRWKAGVLGASAELHRAAIATH